MTACSIVEGRDVVEDGGGVFGGQTSIGLPRNHAGDHAGADCGADRPFAIPCLGPVDGSLHRGRNTPRATTLLIPEAKSPAAPDGEASPLALELNGDDQALPVRIGATEADASEPRL